MDSALPVQLTSLVGRDAEISQVRDVLRGTRLVTLTGTAGAGKTRLAIAVAARIEQDGRARVCFVDLTPVREVALVDRTLLAAVGGRDEPGESTSGTLSRLLGVGATLLVLDNCEHLVERCAALVVDLLRRAPTVCVLATSRVPLDIPGEVRRTVPPIAEDQAVELFRQRAFAVQPDASLGATDRPAVAALCHHLDNLPLAIELAAARMGQIPIDEVLARIDHRLDLLTQNTRGLPDRHRSLSAALDWSRDLLDDAARLLFDRLSVFAGGFSVDAAERVAGASLDSLGRLIDHSLVVPGRDAAGLARHRLLEIIREYAAQHLEERSGEAGATRARHFGHYAELASAARPEIEGPRQDEWLRRLDDEHDNLRVALAWGRDHDPVAALGMAAALAWFWNVRGHRVEAVAQLDALCAAAADAPPHVRAAGLTALGRLATNLPDQPGALVALDESVALWRHLDDDAALAHALLSRGLLGVTLRKPLDTCLAFLGDALEAARRCGDGHQEALALAWTGIAHASLAGDHDAAVRWTALAVDVARRRGDLWALAFSLDHLGLNSLATGDPAGATRCHRESLQIWERLEDPEELAEVNAYLGHVALARGDLREARRRLVASIEYRRLFKSGPKALQGMAQLAAAERRHDRAVLLFAGAAAMPEHATRWPAELDAQPWYPAALRALGPEQVDALWQQGRHLSHEQAVAEALRDDGPPAAGVLTRREREIAALVGRGLRNRDIAAALFISERTVDGHLENIRQKLGVRTRTEVAMWLAEQEETGTGAGTSPRAPIPGAP